MSNSSEENKGGVLNGEVLKLFFAVTGKPGSFAHYRGMERFPDNWYKRPSSRPKNTVDTNVDTVTNGQMYSGTVRFGDNTGTTNSFVSVDQSNLTNGSHSQEGLICRRVEYPLWPVPAILSMVRGRPLLPTSDFTSRELTHPMQDIDSTTPA